MSKLVAVRIPDVMAEKIAKIVAKTGRKQTEVILEAIDAGLIHGYSPKPTALVAATLPPAVQAIVQPASTLPSPKKRTKCPRCDAPLVPWGPQLRCKPCAANYPNTI